MLGKDIIVDQVENIVETGLAEFERQEKAALDTAYKISTGIVKVTVSNPELAKVINNTIAAPYLEVRHDIESILDIVLDSFKQIIKVVTTYDTEEELRRVKMGEDATTIHFDNIEA